MTGSSQLRGKSRVSLGGGGGRCGEEGVTAWSCPPMEPRNRTGPALAAPTDPHGTWRRQPRVWTPSQRRTSHVALLGLEWKPSRAALTQSHQFPKAQPLKPPRGPCWPRQRPLRGPELPCGGSRGRGAGHTGTGGTGAKRRGSDIKTGLQHRHPWLRLGQSLQEDEVGGVGSGYALARGHRPLTKFNSWMCLSLPQCPRI